MANNNKSGALPRLVAAGDIAIEISDPEIQMAKVAPYFQQSGIAFCNCEWPLTDRGVAWPGKPGRVVRSSPEMIKLYTYCGFDVVTLANNHIMNYGSEGLFQTIDILDANGIVHCGAGKNLEEAHKPAFVEWNGTKVAFLGYTSVFQPGFEATKDTPGMAVIRIDSTYRVPPRLHEVPGLPMVTQTKARPADTERMSADIAAAAKEADAVVVAFHWGVSGGHQHLIPYQIEVGQLAVDAGAKLIVGHHPHTIQPVELYKNGVIAYSVGHCGFDMDSESIVDESILIELAIEKGGLGKPLVRPLGNAVKQPEILDLKKGRSCMEWLARMSLPHGTRWHIRDDAGEPTLNGDRINFV
jgi:poly-gamma-glutamate capsule biosynthesis protein CapA/YwtB (metallophosphatase superfamily)